MCPLGMREVGPPDCGLPRREKIHRDIAICKDHPTRILPLIENEMPMRISAPIGLLALLAVGCGSSGAPAGTTQRRAEAPEGRVGGAVVASAAPGGTAGGAGSGVGRSYTTAFPLTRTRSPKGGTGSTGRPTGSTGTSMSTTPGLAIGHQSGSSYTDGTALLAGAGDRTRPSRRSCTRSIPRTPATRRSSCASAARSRRAAAPATNLVQGDQDLRRLPHHRALERAGR